MPDQPGKVTGWRDYGRAVKFNYLDFSKAFSNISYGILIDKASNIWPRQVDRRMAVLLVSEACHQQHEVHAKAVYLRHQYWGPYSWVSSLVTGQDVPSASFQVTQNWEVQLIDQMAVLTFRGTSAGWENGPVRISLSSTEGNTKSCTGEEHHQISVQAGDSQLDSNFAGKATV